MSLTKFVLIAIIILFITKRTFLQLHVPQIKRIECPLNPALCLNPSCYIRTIRGKVTLLNAGCYLAEPVKNFSLGFAFERQVSKRYQVVYEYLDNGCKIIEGGVSSPIIARLLQSLMECMTQLPKKCPVTGNVTAHDCIVDLGIFPNIFPNGNYRTHMHFFNAGKYQNESIFKVILYVVI